MIPSHELTKAFLFLRTASTAVKNLEVQVESTKVYSHWNSVNSNYSVSCAYSDEVTVQEQDLKTWETRYAHAGAGPVNWTAKMKIGRWLPAEIVGIIQEMVYNDRNLDLPRIW